MKCAVCEYESDNKEDFNDSSPGRSLCKMRGHWECVRDLYTILFLKDHKHSAGEVEDEIKEIKADAVLDRKKKNKYKVV